MTPSSYLRVVDYALTFIVIVLGIFSVLQAEGRVRLIFFIIIAALFVLPAIGHAPAMRWVVYGGKTVFGLWCYIYLKSKGFWSFGR